MKVKHIYSLVIVGLLTLLVACGPAANNNGNKVIDETAPVISGVKTIYHEVGEQTPNYLQGVSAFDETDGNVTNTIIVDSSAVNLGVEGEYDVVYYAFDNSGNRGSKIGLVNVSEVETVDLTAPGYPNNENVTVADMITKIDLGVEGAKLTVKPPLIEILYNEIAAQDMSWQTHYTIKLASQNYTRKTHLGMNVLGAGISIYVKLITSDQVVLVEKEITSTAQWREITVEIPEIQRHLLGKNLEMIIYAPKPALSNQSGSLLISGIWFEGDKEPSIKEEYDPSQYSTVYQVDLSDLSNSHDSFDETGTAGGGLITAVYDEIQDTLTFSNNGFNEWANMAFQIPDKDGYGNPLALSDVVYVVIEMSVSEGAIIKAKSDWNSSDLFEFDGVDDGTVQTWLLPVGSTGYAPWAAVSFAPSYLRGEVSSSTIVVHSIKLVKGIFEG